MSEIPLKAIDKADADAPARIRNTLHRYKGVCLAAKARIRP